MSHRTVVRVQLVGFLVATSLGLGVTIQVLGTVPASAQTVVDGCTVVSNPTPTDYTECPDKNLSSANFQGLDLQYANLSGDTFAYCTNISEDQGCAGTAFEDANLEDSNVSDSLFDVWEIVMPPGQPFGTFYGAEANLTGATMSGTNASGITGGLINWSKTAVNDVNFTGATLSEEQFGSDFAGDDLTDTNFTEAQLDGVDFIGAKVGEANFNNAKVAQASFTETVLVPQNQTVEATSRHGAKVTWSTPPPIEGLTPGACSPASGSRFPIGTTEPSCKVNGEGTNNAAVGGFYVDVQAPSALTVTTTSLPAATPGESYSAQLSASGGFSPHRWKIVSGTLPKGLRIHGTKGVISGTCSKDAATSTFTVEVSTPGSEPHTRDTAEASLTIEVS